MSLKHLTPRSTIFTLVVIIILFVLGWMIATGLTPKELLPKKEPEIAPPRQTVQYLYNWYMSYKGNPVDTGSYKYVEYLTSGFINEIDNRSFKGSLNYDPFVCHNEKPLGVSIVKEDVKDNNATITVSADYGEDKEIPVYLVLEGNEWKVSGIGCPQIDEQKQKEEEKKQKRVTLFLTNTSMNETDDEGCAKVYKIERVVADDSDQLTTAIKELFKGVNKAEEIQGYTSVFKPETEEMLKGIQIADNKVYVSLRGYEEFKKVLTPCEIKSFNSQIKETIKYYGYDQEVVFE